MTAMLVALCFLISREGMAQSELAKMVEWTAKDGIAGELSGAPIRALGYDGPVPVKQKAFRGAGITHLFYITDTGEILIGYVDQQFTILWRLDRKHEMKNTAHGDMAERKMWSVPNSEHAELFAKELAYWIERSREHGSDKHE